MVDKKKRDQRPPGPNGPLRFGEIVLVVVLLALSLGILAHAMIKPLSRDEHMYCTAGALLAQGKMIYRDFSYMSQLPYHPLLLAVFYRLLNTQHYLLVGRLISAVCDIVTIICIVLVYRRVLDRSRLYAIFFGACAAFLYAYHPLVQYANGYAWNHDVVVACVAVSFLLFTTGRLNKSRPYLRAGIISALLTLATCMRITTVMIEVFFFLIIVLQGRLTLRQRVKTALSFIGVSIAVLLWPLYLLARAPQAFLLNVVRMSVLNGQWLHQIGLVYDKWQLVFAHLMLPIGLMLVILTVYLWCVAIHMWRKRGIGHPGVVLLSLLLPAGFYLIAFIPPAMWQQYLAVPVPFWLMSLAFPLAIITESAGMPGGRIMHRTALAIVVLSTLVAVFSSPPFLRQARVLADYDGWTAGRLDRISKSISDKTKSPQLILTTAPLYALEGGCNIYPQLSAGVIVYRTADAMSEQERLATNTVGLEGLAGLLAESPPSSVLVGVEKGRMSYLEEPFKKAVGQDWQTASYEDGLTLYYKP